jgi:hypothetical protein
MALQAMTGASMRLSRGIDLVLRGAAIATAVVAAPAVWMLGIVGLIARDLGVAALAGLVLVGGTGLLGLLIIASVRLNGVAAPGQQPTRGNSPLIRAVVYFAGLAGPLVAAGVLWDRSLEAARYQEVAARSVNFPALSPKPSWVIRIAGDLPPAVPLTSLEAYYTVGTSRILASDLPQGCMSSQRHGGFPLHHTERIPISRSGGRYQASVIVDKFLPGPCGWHLRDVGFRLQGTDVLYAVTPYDQRYSMRGPLAGSASPARMDIWCATAGKPFFRHYACDTVATLPPDLAALHSAGQDGATVELWAYPKSGSLEVDFHDIDAPAAAAN